MKVQEPIRQHRSLMMAQLHLDGKNKDWWFLRVGYNEEQIAAANARDEGPTYEDKYYMAVTESIAKTIRYDVDMWTGAGRNTG